MKKIFFHKKFTGARQHVGYYVDEEEGAVAYVHALQQAELNPKP
jgi:hypothetical protein